MPSVAKMRRSPGATGTMSARSCGSSAPPTIPPRGPPWRGRAAAGRARRRRRFFIVTVVPFPGLETTSKSSIKRRAPGSPSPSPPDVEYPSCRARVTSGIPGPWSRATTIRPSMSPFITVRSVISPRLAYMRMLRAISEMAAAMTVWSPLENPASAASSRPFCRALTTSTSDVIGTSSSSATGAPSLFVEALPALPIQKGEPLFEVERGRDALERQAELHHREGDLGLDADDHRFGPAQPRHVRDVPQRADGEGVHDVERRHVDDHTAGAILPDALDQGLA